MYLKNMVSGLIDVLLRRHIWRGIENTAAKPAGKVESWMVEGFAVDFLTMARSWLAKGTFDEVMNDDATWNVEGNRFCKTVTP